MFLLNGKQSTSVTPFKDPFKSDCVNRISIFIYPKDNDFHASIDFNNGNTSGSQRIEAADFNGLVQAIDAFIKTLK